MRKRVLEYLTTALVAIAALLNIIWFIEHRQPNPNAPQSTQITSLIGTKAGIGVSEPSVLLALSTQCRFCDKSVPFYSRLVTLRNSLGGRFKIYAVFFQGQREGIAYSDAHGLSFDGVLPAHPGIAKITATPALLLLDRDSTITAAWVGRLDEQKQNQVMAAIRHATTTTKN
jgi:hypothetical protein